MSRAWVRWLLVAGAMSPAIVPLAMILKYGVNLPYLDQWHPDMAGMFVKAHQGTLTFSDLAAQRNEHRILIPRLIYLPLGLLTHWNVIAEMLAGWVAVCLTSVGILWLIRKSALPSSPTEGPRGRILLLWFLSNLILFNPNQAENWLWGIGLTNFMPAMWLIAALVAVRTDMPAWPRTMLLILVCAFATFSFGNGFLAWPLSGLVVAWSESWAKFRSKLWILLSLLAGMGICLGLYFANYTPPSHGVSSPYATNVVQILHFTLAFLGNLFANSTALGTMVAAPIAGSILLGLFLAAFAYFLHVWLRRDFELAGRMLVWFAVAGYALLNAAMISFSRAGFYPRQAILSRYSSFSLYLPLALVQLVPMVCDDVLRSRRSDERAARPWIQLPAVLAILMASLEITSLQVVLNSCNVLRSQRQAGKAALSLIRVVPDNPSIALLLDPDVPMVLDQANQLDSIGYIQPPLVADVHASKIQASAPATDDPASHGTAEKMWQPSAEMVTMIGWAVLPEDRSLPVGVFLTYDDQSGQPIIFAAANETALPRPDIAEKLGNSDFFDSGWSATFPLAKLPPQPQVVINSWILDCQTGKAYRLARPFKIYR